MQLARVFSFFVLAAATGAVVACSSDPIEEPQASTEQELAAPVSPSPIAAPRICALLEICCRNQKDGKDERKCKNILTGCDPLNADETEVEDSYCGKKTDTASATLDTSTPVAVAVAAVKCGARSDAIDCRNQDVGATCSRGAVAGPGKCTLGSGTNCTCQ